MIFGKKGFPHEEGIKRGSGGLRKVHLGYIETLPETSVLLAFFPVRSFLPFFFRDFNSFERKFRGEAFLKTLNYISHS